MIRAACDVELLKLRKSRVMMVTTTTLLLAPALLAAGFTAAAARSGTDPLTLKARAVISGVGWTGYVGALVQVFATAGLLGLGIGVAWCFGREYADRTVESLYACATPRGEVATAKLVLLTLWSGLVAAAIGPVALLVGLATGLGVPNTADLVALGRLAVLALLTGAVALTVAVFASIGRGYLPAVGGLIAMVVAAQVAVVAGVGSWFPLSSPALWAMGNPEFSVSIVQLALVPMTSMALAAGTVAWWRRASLV